MIYQSKRANGISMRLTVTIDADAPVQTMMGQTLTGFAINSATGATIAATSVTGVSQYVVDALWPYPNVPGAKHRVKIFCTVGGQPDEIFDADVIVDSLPAV